MLNGLKRDWADPFWQFLAVPLVRAGLTPNQVTLIGFALIAGNCLLYLLHRDSVLFGLGLAFSFVFDALDGAVARIRGMASKFGGYLDAVIDRYQEIAVYVAIAWVTGWWEAVFLALTGSLMVSYNKARTAIEVPIENHAWPDLLERFERIVILCGALILDDLIALPAFLGGRVLFLALLGIGILAHVTAIQRFFRAKRLLTSS